MLGPALGPPLAHGARRRPLVVALWARRFAALATLLAAASLAFAAWCIAADTPEPVLPERWILPVPYTGLAAVEGAPAAAGGGGGGGTVVYHVTKEFGPATLGGLGAVVTMIAQAQTARGVDVRVVLPYYSYLAQYQPRRVRTVTVPYRPRGGGSHEAEQVVAADVFLMQYAGVSVYLLNAGRAGPLSSAFVASDRLNIYTESRTLSWELRDLLFCALAAQLLVDLDADVREPQAVAHLHGATNAVVAPMFRDLVRALGQRARTAFVYTLHDYDEETTYHVQIEHLRRLAAFPFAVEPTVHTVVGRHVYLSHFGISQADVVTCVSEVLAADMVEGRQQITNSVLVIDALQAKARARHFVGIPNGVDLVSHSPFNSTVLLRAGLHYDVHSSIAARKAAAKRALCEAGILDRDACERPLILFVGRFQLNKGAGAGGEAWGVGEREGKRARGKGGKGGKGKKVERYLPRSAALARSLADWAAGLLAMPQGSTCARSPPKS